MNGATNQLRTKMVRLLAMLVTGILLAVLAFVGGYALGMMVGRGAAGTILAAVWGGSCGFVWLWLWCWR